MKKYLIRFDVCDISHTIPIIISVGIVMEPTALKTKHKIHSHLYKGEGSHKQQTFC